MRMSLGRDRCQPGGSPELGIFLPSFRAPFSGTPCFGSKGSLVQIQSPRLDFSPFAAALTPPSLPSEGHKKSGRQRGRMPVRRILAPEGT